MRHHYPPKITNIFQLLSLLEFESEVFASSPKGLDPQLPMLLGSGKTFKGWGLVRALLILGNVP
jgi:hypothetical protein